MPEKDVIVTRDLNEVAKIHSNPKYASYRCEVVDGEYRFYAPNGKKDNIIYFYHGGVESDFDISQLDVLRKSQKQQKKTTDYAGFYMYGEQNYEDAVLYAIQENELKNTDTKGVVKISMPSDIKIYHVPPFTITRITKEQIEQLQQQGYDLIAGSMLGKTEYVLLNKDKIIDMQFQSLDIKREMKQEEKYVALEQLEPLLSESGYMCLGHGTSRSGDSDEIVDSIFKEGLRTKDNSLYYTTVILSTPTPEFKKMHQESGLPEPSIDQLKEQFHHWKHLDSKKIIIARIPKAYINEMGDISDLDGERYGAFYTEKQMPNKVVYYLNPKFIVGCYDVEKQMVKLNPRFEKEFTQETIVAMAAGHKKALEKLQKRLDRVAMPFATHKQDSNLTQIATQTGPTFDNFDADDIDWDALDFDWDDPGVGKGK